MRYQEKEDSVLRCCCKPGNSNNKIMEKQNMAISTRVINTVTGFPGKVTVLLGRENEIRNGKYVIYTGGTKVRRASCDIFILAC